MATKTLSMSKLCKKYQPLILKHLADIKSALEEEGYKVGSPEECSDEEYSWRLFGGIADHNPQDPDERDFDIELTIIESLVRDGENKFGVSFSLGIGTFGGDIITAFTPFNYSPSIWVSRKDPDAIKERWNLFKEYTSPFAIVSVIQDYYEEKGQS